MKIVTIGDEVICWNKEIQGRVTSINPPFVCLNNSDIVHKVNIRFLNGEEVNYSDLIVGD